MTPFARAGRGPRPGFTLVELLTVIAIIGLLIGLLVAGAMKFKEAQVRTTSDGQVTRLQRQLNDEYEAVVRKCQREAPPDPVLTFAGGNLDRARAIHMAATLRANLPDNFADAAAAVVVNGYRYEPKTTFRAVRGVNGVPADKQRAVLLYLILTERSSGGGTGDVSGAGGEVKTERLGGRDFSYFVDLYGAPITYFRWAQSAELDQPPYRINAGGSPGSIDPLDPKGLVAGWSGNAGLGLGFANALPGRNRVPTVVSFGKDGVFDSSFNPASDDRVGYRLNRFGNKGDGQ